MGISPVLFQSAGQASQHYIPGAYSRISFAKSNSGSASSNNAVLIGDAAGGEPGLLYVFSSYAEAKETLVSGGLLDALWHAFNPGDDMAPQEVGAVRVNSATQASGTFGLLTLKSADYGLASNRVQVKISTGTTGKLIEVQKDSTAYAIDDVTLPAFTLQYVGTGSAAKLTIDSSTLVVDVTGVTADSVSLDLSTYKTIADIYAFFASKSVFTCSLSGEADSETSTYLDAVTSLDIMTSAQTCNMDLLAVTKAFKSIGLIGDNVTVSSGTRAAPSNTSGWVNLTGGSEGSYTATQFSDVLAYLENQDVQFIGTCSESAAIHSLIKTHCVSMCGVTKKAERQFIVGGASGETVAQAVARAKTLASDKGAICYPGFYAYDQDGNSVLWSPAYYAAKEVGRQVALAINEPATRKQVAILGWEKDLRTSEQEKLIAGGVWCGAMTKDTRYINIRAITTYQSDNLAQNEFSMVREALYCNADLRQALDNAVVGKAMTNGLLAEVDSIVKMRLQGYADLGLFLAANSTAGYWGYKRSIDGSTIKITYECYLTPPTNFVFITARMQVYSDTATSAA